MSVEYCPVVVIQTSLRETSHVRCVIVIKWHDMLSEGDLVMSNKDV